MIDAIIELARNLFPPLGSTRFVIGFDQAVENGFLPVTDVFF